MITLKTLAEATEQQVFDQAVNHLLTQNARAMNGGSCMYRNQAGLKCAAGCFIGDDEYDARRMENMIWGSLVIDGIAPDKHKVLISELQGLHDGSNTEFWVGELKEIAEKYDLKMPDLPAQYAANVTA